MVDLGNKGVDTLVTESPNGLTAVRLIGESHVAAESTTAGGRENLTRGKVVSTMSTLHSIHLSRALLSPSFTVPILYHTLTDLSRGKL